MRGASVAVHDSVSKRTPVHAAGMNINQYIYYKHSLQLETVTSIAFAFFSNTPTTTPSSTVWTAKTGFEKINNSYFIDFLVRTPLMVAVANGYTDCAMLLLSTGARVDLTDIYGRTALHRAVSPFRYN